MTGSESYPTTPPAGNSAKKTLQSSVNPLQHRSPLTSADCRLPTGPSMTPQEFVHKWKRANLSERSGCQQHFLDLCDLLNQPKPAEVDADG
jgi:hypothetical protein